MLSIIIPTLNEEEHLPILLKSIISQDFKDYEIIVADKNSKDKTRQIAKSYKAKIVKGGLPSKARNNGAKAAKGNILLFLDSDVRLSKGSLNKALTQFKKRKLGIALLSIRADTKNVLDKTLYRTADNFLKATQFFKALGAGCCGIMIKTVIHNKIKGYDESRKYGEDTDYIVKASKLGKFGVLTSKVYVSTRRLKVEGRWRTMSKYLRSTIYDILGKDTKKFGYEFDIYKK
jgi:glycosyltransferase involved in cell wall biosynthesis